MKITPRDAPMSSMLGRDLRPLCLSGSCLTGWFHSQGTTLDFPSSAASMVTNLCVQECKFRIGPISPLPSVVRILEFCFVLKQKYKNMFLF